jgi:F-type H+-transporting ATPase subunit gamma
MATLREIKRRITGVKNTQQITRAMKMVAAARLRRAQENIINARPYSRKIAQVLGHLLELEKGIENPLLEEREERKIAIVVVTSDRGLCGGFNMNIIRRVEELLEEDYSEQFENGNVEFYFVGKKGYDHFKNRGVKIAGTYLGIFSKQMDFSFAAKLVKELSEKYTEKEYDKVVVVFNEFKSIIQQNLTVEQFLPLVPEKLVGDEEEKLHAEYIYEPDKASIIHALIPKTLNSRMWRVFLESYAAELGARMTAMDMATENAKELIRTLQLTYNKERQAAITKEILEIVSGANALKKS